MKKLLTALIVLSISFCAFSYEWPIQSIKPESIKSFFAQKRGSTISSSLMMEPLLEKGQEETFSTEVKSCEDGKVLIVLSDIEDDNDFFPSTLGQAVIISHSDNIISVYGNLDNKAPEKLDFSPDISEGSLVGTIGATAWTNNKGSLELGIIDTKESLAINPRLLLPRIEKEKSFPPAEIYVENKDGKRFDLNTNRSFLSGTYKFYQKRNETMVPLKVSISVNGELVDEIEFNQIFQKDNNTYINGLSKKYETQNMYPDDKLFLIGEAKIAKGKSIITFENTNHSGEKRMVNYAVTIY